MKSKPPEPTKNIGTRPKPTSPRTATHRDNSNSGDVNLNLELFHVSQTAKQLVARVQERFGDSKLLMLTKQVDNLVTFSEQRLRRGVWLGRIVAVALLPPTLAILFAAGWGIYQLNLNYEIKSASDVFQGLDAASQILLMLLGMLVVALSLGTRIRRRSHLKVIAELRAFAHVIDMHQLDKDPDRLIRTIQENTAQSPDLGKVTTPFLLSRYLDYCGEMLALVSKVAALYSERIHDPEVLNALHDVEDLCSRYRLNIGIKMTSIMTLVHAKSFHADP